jgi:hypothetical protein
MMKKSYDKRKRFRSRKGFNRRYFTLTTTELRYSKEKEGKSVCTIPACHILDVKRPDDCLASSGADNGISVASASVCMSNVFCIIQPDERSLLIQVSAAVSSFIFPFPSENDFHLSSN